MDDEDSFIIEEGSVKHLPMAGEISKTMEESALARGTGISKRSPQLIEHYMLEGKALVATAADGSWAGFCYLNVFGDGRFVTSSGLIVSPKYRNRGLASLLKQKLFAVSRERYPQASLVGITTSPAVMKINTQLGFYPTAFSDMPQDESFWKGCASCVNHDILVRTQRKMCLCTAMRYDPREKKQEVVGKPEKTVGRKPARPIFTGIERKRFMKTVAIFVALVALTLTLSAQDQGTPLVLHTATGAIQGTLLMPATTGPVPVALLIAGSGPTDRDGNNPMAKNNSLKLLAEALQSKGFATLRYDKRGIAASRTAGGKEEDLRFEHYAQDAAAWVRQLKTDPRFSRVVIIGHSEGSLLGMIAAQQSPADRFISLDGAGYPAGDIIRQQLAKQPQAVTDVAYPIIDSLNAGKTVSNVNMMLYALFRPSVQPYLISWFKYNPQTEISKLKIPVLVVQGLADIQVPNENATMLFNALKGSKLAYIRNMNHVLKETTTDVQQNMATYNNPDLPVAPELVGTLTTFMK